MIALLGSRLLAGLLLLGCGGATVAASVSLATLDTPPAATSAMIGAPPQCKEGFVASAVPTSALALPLPAGGGATFSAADEARWKSNVQAESGAATADVQNAGPGDWARIKANASQFLDTGEDPASNSNRSQNGMKARDAAFYFLITGDGRQARAVSAYLLAMAQSSLNDFTSLCFRLPDNTVAYDAYYEQAAWVLRYTVTYDYVRSAMALGDRLVVENYIRRQAYFFAAHLDWNLRMIFPNRLSGDYAARLLDARPKNPEDAFVSKRFDTLGHCKVGPDDDPASYPVFAYIDGSGAKGPRLTRLSQWYHNRKSAAAAAIGAAGLVLNDTVLMNRAKRYVMEWLTYSVWPDGSEGEYFRNGDYCIARQGLIYAQYNIQAAALLAHWLQLNGDASLSTFSTPDGLFGTEAPTGPGKSIATVVNTELQILSGQLDWYYAESWKPTQTPRAATRLGQLEGRYMNSNKTQDNHQALGLLLAEHTLPGVPVRSVLLKDAADAVRRSRGANGNSVATGYGQWQDIFGALPAVLLLK